MQVKDRSATHVLVADHDLLTALAERTAAASDPLVRLARQAGVLQPAVTTADFLLALKTADGVGPRARRILLRGLFQ